MQETMTIKEVEEVIKMKLFTFIADYICGHTNENSSQTVRQKEN